MRPAPSSASAALRTFTRHTLPTSQTTNGAARLATTSPVASHTQRRSQSGAASSLTFQSPFRDNKVDTNQIPSFKAYRSKAPEVSNRVFQYFMVGSMGLLTAAGAKATVQGTTQIATQRSGSSNLTPYHRFPGQHVRLRRRPRAGQGRSRHLGHPRRQERHHQMARQACFHSSPYCRRDQAGRIRQVRFPPTMFFPIASHDTNHYPQHPISP